MGEDEARIAVVPEASEDHLPRHQSAYHTLPGMMPSHGPAV